MARLAFLCLLVAGCGGARSGTASPPEDEIWITPAALERGEAGVAEARTEMLAEPLNVGGRIAFDERRVSHVFSPVTGRVTRVIAPLGQPVEQGSPLAAIVSPDVGTAFSDEAKARADLVAAQHEFERQQKLFAEQAGSQRDFETAENVYRKAQAEAQRALQKRRLLSDAKVDGVTQEYVLPSPIDGRVVARMVNPGMEVQGQYGGGSALELFTVGDTETVWLYADVPEAALAAVRVGLPVEVRVIAYADRVFGGTVEWVSPVLDPALRTARIRASLPNTDGLLKPEMFGTVSIQRPAVPRLAVPRAALLRINDQFFVYVAAGARNNGTRIFKRRHVQVADPTAVADTREAPGREGSWPGVDGLPDLTPVLSGLSAGEQVLVQGLPPRPDAVNEVSFSREQMASGKLDTVAAEEHDVHGAITVGGRLAFDDLRVTHVFSPVNGRVTRLMAAPGDHVKAGAPLALILSPDLGSAFADELKAKADRVAAEKEVKRQRELYAFAATARHDVEAAEDDYDRATAEYDRTVQKTRLLRDGALDSLSQEYVLRSPLEGDVVARMATPGLEVQGQYSNAGNVAELFTIGDTADVWLLGEVYEVDLPEVKVGAAVELQVPAYPGRSFGGTVDWVSDTLDPLRRTAAVRVVLPNAQGVLRPNMYGVARIAMPPRRTVTVPRAALMRLGDEAIVFVEGPPAADGRVTFRRQPVIADEQLAGDAVPVSDGLRAGERVATRGAIFLLGLLQQG